MNILQIKGRNYPVQIHYLKKRTSDLKQTCLNITLSLLSKIKNKNQGNNYSKNDILIFFSGKEEIEDFVQTLIT